MSNDVVLGKEVPFGISMAQQSSTKTSNIRYPVNVTR